jgi:hypothetical protein
MRKNALDLGAIVAQHPELTGALTGAAIGAPLGYLRSDEDEKGTGALTGAVAGAGMGALGGYGAGKVNKLLELLNRSPATKVLLASGLLGAGGAYMGSKWIAPAIAGRSARARFSDDAADSQEKEGSTMADDKAAQEKAAQEKTAQEIATAFSFGVDTAFAEKGINKEAFVKQAGLKNADELDGMLLQWLLQTQKPAAQ